MSYFSLLTHRCDLYDLVTRDDDGSPVTAYFKVNQKPIRCRLDVGTIRQGSRDAAWMDAVARPTDRVGTMFFLLNAPIISGMRVKMTKGPQGMFHVLGAIDEKWGYEAPHHLEMGVIEVSSLQANLDLSQIPGGSYGS